MKPHVVFAIAAAIASLTAVLLVRAPAPSTSADSDAPADAPASTVAPVIERTDPQETLVSPAPEAAAEIRAPLPEHAIESLSLEELQVPCGCRWELHQRQVQYEQDLRNAQTKDPGWAYETEQLLQQFVASNLRSHAVDEVSVECRTTFCDIRANGSIEAATAFEEVIKEAQIEPWSTFNSGRQIRTTPKDTNAASYQALVYRESVPDDLVLPDLPEPSAEGSCPCASDAWQGRRLKLEQEARANEIKDPYWAYEKEQRLNTLVADHELSSVLESWTVDCRQTYCDIRATMTGEEQGGFNQLILEIAQDPTLGFGGNWSVAASGIGEALELEARLMRAPDTDR